MSDRIEAIYENGVFKPLAAVALPDHQRVVLIVEPEKPEPQRLEQDIAEIVARQKQAAAELDAILDYSKDQLIDDGLTSEQHDQILYGDPS